MKSAGMQPPEGPPVCTALNPLPSSTPPPMSSMMVRSRVPMGTSMSPVRLILPARAKVLVPRLLSVPMLLYQAAPFSRMALTAASVSTLLMLVGLPNRPALAGKGGRDRGMPRLPSILCMSEVSSPQTKAPAPFLILISKLKPEPRMFSPTKPSSRIWAMAACSRSMASGYSARQ